MVRASRIDRGLIAALTLISVLFVGACGPAKTEEPPKAGPATLSIGIIESHKTVTDSDSEGTSGVEFQNPFTIMTDNGEIESVAIKDESGKSKPGTLSQDKKTWTVQTPLDYGTTYSVNAKAVSPGGDATLKRTFTTAQPGMVADAILSTEDGEEVGQGQTVNVFFDAPVTDRKAAQDAIHITTDPVVDGAFYWVNSSTVHWRPEHFWEPGTKVTVSIESYGKNLGGNVYGQRDFTSTFTVSRDVLLAEADDATKQVTVKKNGEAIRTMSTSMGMPGMETPNGIYIVAERSEQIIMDSSTFGVPVDSPLGYRTPVDYATRISINGIFVHSAPWSVWAQGKYDTSHGCLNLSPEDAKWFFDTFRKGDIVTVKGTAGDVLSGVDGLGDWNMDWETWKKGNAND